MGEVSYFNQTSEQSVATFAAAPPFPPAMPTASPYPRDEGRWLLQPDWGRIGFSIDAEDYYQYQVVPGVFGINRGFIVKAIGDLDGDGVLSTFQRAAYLSAGEIQGRQIEIINALE
jgi:hypothetical protein